MIVACVEWGGYLGRASEYVRKLKSMVARHLSVPHSFICLTDDPTRHPGLTYDEYHELPVPNDSWRADDRGHALTGWWAKLYLFSGFRFPVGERVLYLDLDSVVVGSLDELVKHKGILHLDRWGWERQVYGSGVMVFDGGEHADIWEKFTPGVPRRFGGEGQGDQNWITELGGWPALPDGLCMSYRYHCKKGVPAGASVVAFHGHPKMHELPPEHWVHEHWR